MKVIFTKYSDVGRQKKYRIKTQIIEKNGKKIVFKEALNTESQQHITKMYKNGKKLKKAGFPLKLVKSWIKDKKIFFDYVEGTSLDELAIDIFFSFGKKKLFEKLKEIKPIIDKTWNSEIVNLDMTLDNMIQSETGEIFVIDYEWIYEGKIEKNFLFYRLLSIFYHRYGIYFYYKFSFDEMLKEFFDESLIEEMKKLNENFYSERLETVNIDQKEHKPLEKVEYLELFFDNGYVTQYYFDYTNEISINISIPKGVKVIRIDPKNMALNMKITNKSFINTNNEKRILGCSTNAIYNDEENYIFTTEDPQIYFDGLSEGTVFFSFKQVKLGDILDNKKIIIE